MLSRLIKFVVFSVILFVFLSSNPASVQAGSIVLREGNNCGQDFVTSFPDSPGSYNLKRRSGTNDEARSLELFDVEAGTKILVFDSPSGSRSDDWTEMNVSKLRSYRCVGSFEGPDFGEEVSGETAFGFVYHSDNGLDGKVSRVEVSKSF